MINYLITWINRPQPAQSSGPVNNSDDDSGLLGPPNGSDFNCKQLPEIPDEPSEQSPRFKSE